ncbi:MAG: hypothetical protein ACRD07_07530 [Acidimicrobiales bacterium]
MAVDEHARVTMYEAFKRMVGTEHATTLLDHLPHHGWEQFATKRDLVELEHRLDLRWEARMNGFEARLQRELRDVQRNLFFGFLAAQTAFAGLVIAVG